MGIDAQGRRTILGTSVSLSEAEPYWRDFLASLQARGLHGVRMIASDSHAGLKEALRARCSGAPWQRCRYHLARNAVACVPKVSMRKEVGASLRAVFDAPERAEAERQLDLAVKKYRTTAPRLAERMEANVPEGLTAFALLSSHRRRLRTTNMLERINRRSSGGRVWRPCSSTRRRPSAWSVPWRWRSVRSERRTASTSRWSRNDLPPPEAEITEATLLYPSPAEARENS
jgi:transposase-like protein